MIFFNYYYSYLPLSLFSEVYYKGTKNLFNYYYISLPHSLKYSFPNHGCLEKYSREIMKNSVSANILEDN